MTASTMGAHPKILLSLIGLTCIAFLLSFTFASCAAQPNSDKSAKETQLRDTELEMNVQQTLNAQREVDQGVAGTLQAQAAQKSLTAAPAAAVTPQAVVPDAGRSATAPAQPATPVASPAQTLAPTAPPSNPDDLVAQMKQAKILVFEDMISMTNTNRYVKDTLNKMGLPFTDTGNAIGMFQQQLKSGGPDGKGWDLVILSSEAKTGFSGDFYDYANQALDQGASVIMEVWNLDKVYTGKASSLLGRCGVAYQANLLKIPPAKRVMFALEPTDPILSQPNSIPSFTKVTDYWWDKSTNIAYDIGDLVQLAQGGDAHLLVGTVAGDKSAHGTLTECLAGKLTLQTFSSHIFDFKVMGPAWENYIYNALKVKLTGGRQ